MSHDWYASRHLLSSGDVFSLHDGDTVRLDRRVPGDGTQWYADTWHNGHWSCDDYTIEPGDLKDRVPDPALAQG